MSLLESAGFSRSNPYYVVQQGKIAALTLMKNSERLDLLKEIGGTRTYEERRRESFKIIQNTGKYFLLFIFKISHFVYKKRKHIDQVVQNLDERLKELDEEKEELGKYHDLEKQRKSLEYAILDKEVQDAKQNLAKKSIGPRFPKYQQSRMTKEHQNFIKEKEVSENLQTKALQKHTVLELDLKDLQAKTSGNTHAKEDATKQPEMLENEIKVSMDELDKIIPLYDGQVQEEKDITKRIMECEKKLSILYQKQGRATQFSSKAARDKWLQKEIDDREPVLSSSVMQEKNLVEEIARLNNEIHGRDENIKSRRTNLTTLESHTAMLRKCSNDYKVKRDELHEERKSLWTQENELTAITDKGKVELEKAEKNLQRAIPGGIRRGLNSVRKICKSHNISGVHGPIIELLNCDEKFFAAVEMTAGIRKWWTCYIIPLNRVRAPDVTYPQRSDVIPLIQKLNFKDDYTPAFRKVFAGTVICEDLDVASKVARTNGLNCITLEGDQVSNSGTMTGGFFDHRQSILKFMNIVNKSTDSIFHIKEGELEQVKLKIHDIL
ncbi:putative structural maintenance of chromosomes protein [Medicago truncatula]|uniref:Putative structural maintenance of chromosomes protein n=1 Tax=Medicago truncatula TaxID=3880 RepID=A0A396J278_MEDTR|nr:putative structural maintenance of chromosomes protein [Medicago truncatula]